MSEDTPQAQRGELEFPLGGHRFVLEPTFARIDKLETALGRPLIQVATEITYGRLAFRDVATIIHVMARNTKLSRAEIGELVVGSTLNAALPGLRDFLARVLGGTTNEGKEVAGESSGPSSPGDAG